MRLALLVVVVAVLVLLLPTLLRRLAAPAARPARSLPDELVKDPVCQTYVVKSRAVTRASADGTRYFCSAECAGRFTGDRLPCPCAAAPRSPPIPLAPGT